MIEEKENCVYTYRYILKKKDSVDGTLYVFLRTGSVEDHKAYSKVLQEDSDVLSCIREYVCTYDLGLTAEIDHVKVEEKKEGDMNV